MSSNWLRHVTKISNKASRILGLLERALTPCSQSVKSIACTMLVRPHIEYTSEVWSQYTMKCMRKRYGRFLRARVSNSNTDWSMFLKFTNSVAKSITLSHVNYISNVIGSNLVENPKCIWSYDRLKTDNIHRCTYIENWN